MNKLAVLIAATVGFAGSSIAHADKTFLTGKGATWDCKQDPVVTINHGKGTYTFKGSCKTINLNSGGSTLTIDSVDSLNINGANNTVTVNTTDSINIVGSLNTVTYRSAIHGDAPSVSKVGSNNVVNGGGKPADADKPAAHDRAADSAGAQDCNKAPTAVIDNGEGTYKFIGPCTRIVVDGGDNTLVIESVKEITINGSTNTVTIGSADKISVMGSENKVRYRKGISGARPKVGSLGENNTVTQVN